MIDQRTEQDFRLSHNRRVAWWGVATLAGAAVYGLVACRLTSTLPYLFPLGACAVVAAFPAVTMLLAARALSGSRSGRALLSISWAFWVWFAAGLTLGAVAFLPENSLWVLVPGVLILTGFVLYSRALISLVRDPRGPALHWTSGVDVFLVAMAGIAWFLMLVVGPNIDAGVSMPETVADVLIITGASAGVAALLFGSVRGRFETWRTELAWFSLGLAVFLATYVVYCSAGLSACVPVVVLGFGVLVPSAIVGWRGLAIRDRVRQGQIESAEPGRAGKAGLWFSTGLVAVAMVSVFGLVFFLHVTRASEWQQSSVFWVSLGMMALFILRTGALLVRSTRAEEEARLGRVFEAGLPKLVIDRSFRVVAANRGFVGLVQFDDVLTGLGLSDQADSIKTSLKQVLDTNQELDEERTGSRDRCWRLDYSPVPWSQEKAVLVVVENITERKRVEEELAQSRKHLEELVEERTQELRQAQDKLVRREKLATLGQIAGSIAHELRNPLGAMRNAVYFLNMIVGRELKGKAARHLKIINDEIDRSDRIITSLLDFAKGRPRNPVPCSVAELMQDVLDMAQLPSEVKVSLDIPQNLPEVNVDDAQITQVFLNILRNAIQAMAGQGRISITGDKADTRVRVRIVDNGPGIEPELMERLFEPLFSTRTFGTGLGLAICRTFVEANGGTIEVSSELGKGTTFTVILPAAENN